MSQSVTEGLKQEMEVRTEPENQQKHLWLACYLWLAQHAFNSRQAMERQYCPHWFGPSHISHISRKQHTDLPMEQSDRENCLVENVLSQMSNLCQVYKQTNTKQTKKETNKAYLLCFINPLLLLLLKSIIYITVYLVFGSLWVLTNISKYLSTIRVMYKNLFCFRPLCSTY